MARELDDRAVHDRIEVTVRARFSGQAAFVWEVKAEYCREGLLVSGRASREALQHYCSLVPSERWFIVSITEV